MAGHSVFAHREEIVGAFGCIHGLVGGAEEHRNTGGGAGINADSRSGSDYDVFDIRGELFESSMEGLFHAGECSFIPMPRSACSSKQSLFLALLLSACAAMQKPEPKPKRVQPKPCGNQNPDRTTKRFGG